MGGAAFAIASVAPEPSGGRVPVDGRDEAHALGAHDRAEALHGRGVVEMSASPARLARARQNKSAMPAAA